MHFIKTDKAPQPVGAYSQAVRYGNLIFVSGQLPIDPATSEMVGTTIAEQTKQVMDNLAGILASEGLGLNAILKTTILLANLDDFAGFNEAYAQSLGEHQPARAAFEVSGLFKGALVEIEAVACAEV